MLELRRKLKRHGGGDAETEALIDALTREGWIDERRFTEAFVRSRSGRGMGPLRIDAELRERGIGAALARSAVWDAGECWESRAETARRKRFGDDAPEEFAERARQSRFLERRGFTREQVGRVLRRSRTESIDD